MHRLHRRDRRRRHAPAGAEPRRHRRLRGRLAPAGRARLSLLWTVRCAQPVRRPHPREPAVARAAVHRARAAVARPLRVREPDEQHRQLHVPRRDGRRLARAQPAARRHGRDRQPAVLQEVLHEQDEHAARRDLHRPASRGKALAAHPRREAAQRADLLHRRDERSRRPARPGAHAPGTHGPPRLVPHADEAGPPRRPRPLPRQGRARAGARPAAQTRGDRARHERLCARDAGAGHVDGAHDRAPLGPRGVELGRPRRSHDNSRGRHRSRHRVHPGGEPRRCHSRGGPCRRRPRLPEGRGVNAALHPDARRRARAPPGAREGGALQSLPE